MLKRCSTARILLTLALLCGSFAAAQSKGTFQAGINYPAGPATVPSNTGFLLGGIIPLEVHTGDFNGDGKPDVVVAANCTSPGGGSYGYPGCPASGYPVVVYLSNGDGTFQSGIPSGGPAQALRSIAVGDFNGDGKLDIAAASDCSDVDCTSGTMVILLGNGDGTFTGTGVTYPLGGIVSQHNTITVGDLNGDGKADVVVTLACDFSNGGCAQGAVKVYLGNGDGSLQAPNSYPTIGNGGIPVVIGDFNKDGKPDVLVATPANTLVFFPGNGDGTIGTPVSSSLSAGGAQSITAGDFNSDGNLDVVVGQYTSATVVFGNGDGTFQSPVAYDLNANVAESIVAVDMNGDGKLDLMIGGGQIGSFNTAVLLLNDGTGNFSNLSTFYLGGWEGASLGVADFNGDGKNDVVLASFGAGDQYVGSSDGTLSVLLGNGDGTMRSARYLSEGPDIPRPAVATADFNGDGFQDLIFPSGCGAGASCTPSGFTLLLSDGAGYQAPLVFTAPVKQSHFLAVGDFNHDGKPDVAVFNDCDTSCTGSSVSIFLNTGNGTFAAPVVYESGGVTPLSITTGDFNGDGKIDVALLQFDSSSQGIVSILLGNGDGTFQPAITTPLGSSNAVWWLAAADFNGDGKTDLVLVENTNNPTNPYEGSAQILLSNGDGTLSFGAIYDSGGRSAAVTTGDVNGDGKTDIVIGNLCDNIVGDANCARGTIAVLLGNGDGTFQSALTQTVPDANMFAISLADVNADGKLDAVTSTGTGIAVFFGNGDGTLQTPTVYAALEVTGNVQLAIADLNGDGGLDIVQPGINGQLAILYNQGFAKTTPTVALQSSLNPSVFGQTVTFTATVTSTSGTPTGTVTFFVLSNITHKGPALGTVTLANGSASLSTNGLDPGTYSIVATYNGDANNSPSGSAGLPQVVNKATVSIVLFSSADPSYVNQTVYFSVQWNTQYGGPIAGTITYMQGTAVLAVEQLTVPYSTTYTTTGTRSITAVYSGDNDNLGSTSQVLKQVVNALPAATKTVVTTSGSPSFINQPVTFTAAVSSTYGPIPDGELITFSDGTTKLASVPLAGGSANYTTSTLKAGNHTIKASYPGDATFKASSGSLKQVISLYPSSTSTPSSSLNPSIYGQSVTLTATVTSTAPSSLTGTVTFKNGTASIGLATLNASGVATLTKANLPAGSLSITAIYNGDSETSKSTSSALTQTVNQATTATALASSRNPSAQGQLVKFTATVTSPTTTPTGAVTFMDGSNVLGTVNLAGGKASYSTSALSTGSHSITGVYSGTANITGSTSATLAQTVN